MRDLWRVSGGGRGAAGGGIVTGILATILVSGFCAAEAQPAADPPEWRDEMEACFAQVDTLPHPGEPYLTPGVKDGIFAYLVGLLERGRFGAATGAHLEAVLESSDRKSSIPQRLIREIRRAPAPGGKRGWARARFDGALDLPVPYSILGYHPGSLVASADAVFEEQYLARLRIPNPGQDGSRMVEITNLWLFPLITGRIEIDIDGWLDALLGGRLDDTYIVGLALFRMEGRWFAMALGFNRKGEGRSGALDLEEDKIRFPSPKALRAVGRALRARVMLRLRELEVPVTIPPGDSAP